MEIPIIEIPDIKQDILDLQNNTSVCIINGDQIYTQTSLGQSLILGKVYRLDAGKIYQDSNFIMRDGQIYANSISNNLPKPLYGYCSRVMMMKLQLLHLKESHILILFVLHQILKNQYNEYYYQTFFISIK